MTRDPSRCSGRLRLSRGRRSLRAGSTATVVGTGCKEGLAELVDTEFSDRDLCFRLQQELQEGPTRRGIDVSAVVRVDQNDVIDVQQRRVTFQKNFESEASAQSEIGAAISNRVAAAIPVPDSVYQAPSGVMPAASQSRRSSA
jgi:hypothetical protein